MPQREYLYILGRRGPGRQREPGQRGHQQPVSQRDTHGRRSCRRHNPRSSPAAKYPTTTGRLGRPALTGDADRIDALLCAAAGDLDAAAGAARAAVTAHGSCPLRLELARSLLVLGRIERRRKARRQARAALRQANELAAAMGHRPLLDQIEREMPRVAAERSETALTATERRMAGLIAAGATNRDAAAALFVSVRTVETHVASIYRKLGVRTRAELARRIAAQ